MTHVLRGGWREACRVPRLPALVLPERLGSSIVLWCWSCHERGQRKPVLTLHGEPGL